KEMVTVLDVSGDYRKDIAYRSSDDVVHSSTKMATTGVEVYDRAKGALTGHELLQLAGHVRSAEPMAPQSSWIRHHLVSMSLLKQTSFNRSIVVALAAQQQQRLWRLTKQAMVPMRLC